MSEQTGPSAPRPDSVLSSRLAPRLLALWRAKATEAIGIDPCLAALMLLVIIYYVATPGIFQGKASGDGYFGFMYLPGLFLKHDINLAILVPDYVPYFGVEPTGRTANPCPIGPVLCWTPSYLLGLLLQKLGLLATPPGQPFGRTTTDYFSAGLGALAAGLFGMAAMFRWLQRRFSLGAARFAVVISVLATPLCFYLVTQ